VNDGLDEIFLVVSEAIAKRLSLSLSKRREEEGPRITRISRIKKNRMNRRKESHKGREAGMGIAALECARQSRPRGGKATPLCNVLRDGEEDTY
jgi:hypothetical protein